MTWEYEVCSSGHYCRCSYVSTPCGQSRGASLLTPKIRAGVKLDPSDPKTWWMVSAAATKNSIPIMAQMYDHAMTLARVPAHTFYSDAQTHMNTIAAVAAYYGLDAATGGGDTYNYEAEAMGQKMIYSDHAMPTIDFREPLIKETGDLRKVKVPAWEKAARIPFILDVIKLNAEMGFTTGKFSAPFSLAVSLRTYPRLIKDLRKEPGFAHDLFTFLVRRNPHLLSEDTEKILWNKSGDGSRCLGCLPQPHPGTHRTVGTTLCGTAL